MKTFKKLEKNTTNFIDLDPGLKLFGVEKLLGFLVAGTEFDII